MQLQLEMTISQSQRGHVWKWGNFTRSDSINHLLLLLIQLEVAEWTTTEKTQVVVFILFNLKGEFDTKN